RGLLREPPAHLRRAHVVVLTGADRLSPAQLESARRQARKFAPEQPILIAGYASQSLRPIGGGDTLPIEWLAGRRIASLCALGNPEGFEDRLIHASAKLVATFRFPDHHRFTPGEVEKASEAALAAGA